MDTNSNTDRDTNIYMNMDLAEIYADRSDALRKFVPTGMITGRHDAPQNFVLGNLIFRRNL
jgi:hypothetical protein